MEGMQGALAPGRSTPEGRAAPDEFPAGLRVLVVDDDVTCLRILERILQRCRFRVTICCQATIALSLLRERKGGYDVVISDVHMPDMDGFRLLELVGLEMDLPVIMMSADGRTSAVMKGIKHGACDYLIKPVRMEELKNIWQHVIRKKWNANREFEYSGSMEDSDHHHRAIDDADYASSVNDVAEGTRKSQKKKRDAKEDEDDGELDNEDPSTSKKSRVVWSVELHQQFVNAVNKIGIEKAVPKRILELMNVPGLTRENVASHLQKFRLYLKRISGVAQHHGGFPNSFLRPEESNATVGPLGRLDFQALVASGQIPQQTLAALHEELLGRPSSGLVLPAIDMPVKGSNCTASEPGVGFGQTLVKCPSNISELLPQNIAVGNMSSGSSLWSSDHLSTTCTTRGITSTLNSDLVKMLQQQQPRTVSAEPHHAIKVQPSSVVVPSSSSYSFQIGDNSALLNHNPLVITSRKTSGIQMGMNPVPSIQNSNLNNICEVEHCIHLSSQTNNVPLGGAKASDGVLKNVGVLDRYATPGPLSSSGSSFSACIDASTSWEAHNSTLSVGPASGLTCHLPNLCNLASEANTGTLPTQGHGRYLGFVGRGTRIPSRFAIDDIESPTKTMNPMKTYMGGDGDRVKQELHLDFTDRSKFGNTAATFFCK